MEETLPEPLVSAEVDLKDFPYTPVYRARLFGSSFHAAATDAEWRAGFTLWLKSWDQVPAGTLPTDDVSLCRLAEFGRDMKSWLKVKLLALHGWQKSTDGRLHHKVVAEGVNHAWSEKQGQRDRTEKARTTRAQNRLSQSLSQSNNPSVTENVTLSVTASKRREEKVIKKDSEATASAAGAAAGSVDEVKEIFDRGVAIVGEKHRSLIGKMRQQYGNPAVLAAIGACETELPSEPVAFLMACCERSAERGRHNGHAKQSPVDTLREGAARAAAAVILRGRGGGDIGDGFSTAEPFLDRG